MPTTNDVHFFKINAYHSIKNSYLSNMDKSIFMFWGRHRLLGHSEDTLKSYNDTADKNIKVYIEKF
jgi:hypothetical protein